MKGPDPLPILPVEIMVRTLAAEDLPALEWNGEFTHYRRLYREIYQAMQHGRAIMWVAELPKVEIVGQIFVQLESSRNELADGVSRAYLYGFRVKPLYRSAGIGARLIETVEEDLQRRHYQWVTLNVARTNLKARRFYVRHGYQVVSADPGQWSYYDDQGVNHQVVEPAWRMLKRLG